MADHFKRVSCRIDRRCPTGVVARRGSRRRNQDSGTFSAIASATSMDREPRSPALANPTRDSVRVRFAPSAALAPPMLAKRRPSLAGWSSGWDSLPFGRDDRTRARIGDIALSSACGTNRNFAGCVPAAWLFPSREPRKDLLPTTSPPSGRPIWMDANAHRRPPRRASLCASYSRPADQPPST
jgi:hypothetical protein